MNYYHRYPGHYIAKTLHLSMEEDGAYTRLLDWMYLNERPVPHDERYAIARAMKASERKAVDKILASYFTKEEATKSDGESGGFAYFNNRVDSEIAKNQPKIQAARENGRKGGRPRKTETHEKPNGFQNENPMGFSEKPTAKAPQTPNTSITPDRSSLAERSQGPEPSSERAQEPETPKAMATAAGTVCRMMRQVGCVHANPSHPDLLAALAEGVTLESLVDTGREAVEKQAGNPFAWAIATARSRHAQGARTVVVANVQPIRAGLAQPSKTMQGLEALEAMKRGTLVSERNPDRAAEALHALAGPDTRR